MGTAEQAGGGAHEQIFPPLIEDPVEIAANAYFAVFDAAAEKLAPDAASAPWQRWPESPTSDRVIPPMLRAGTVGRGHPVLVPVLGESHIVVGDQGLLVPITVSPDFVSQGTKGKTTYMNASVAKSAKEAAAREQNRANAERLGKVAAEHDPSVRVAVNLMTRAVGSMRPGSVRLSVYDPVGRGEAFRGFSPLASRGLFNVVGKGGLSGMLETLDDEVLRINTTVLEGFPSMRALIESTGQAPETPWQFVALLGHNEQLDADDRERLANIIKHGVACGITVLTHGIQIPRHPTLQQLDLLPSSRGIQLRSSALPEIDFAMQSTPPAQVVRATSLAASRQVEPAEAELQEVSAIPTAEDYALGLPGIGYRQLVTSHLRAWEQADTRQQHFYGEHPFLTPRQLHEVNGSNARYLEAIGRLTTNPRALVEATHTALYGSDMTTVDRLMALAGYGLLQSLPASPRTRLYAVQIHEAANRLLNSRGDALADTVSVTGAHGQEQIPPSMRGFIAQYLPDNPPAWAFQLVADGISPTLLQRTYVNRNTARARHAVQTDVETAFQCQLGGAGGQIDQQMLECLTECRLLQLYHFTDAPESLRVLLTRRAHRRLEAVDPNAVPEAARPYYDACMAHLEVIGRVPTTRERISGMVGSAVSALSREKDKASGSEDNSAQQ